MNHCRRHLGVAALAVLFAVVTGCSAAQKTMPHIGYGSIDFEAQFDRDDVVVMNSVEGSSKTTSILFGLVQIIDGNNWKVLGIPFFQDKYTYRPRNTRIEMVLNAFVTTADRAYYRALENAPEADVILVKSMDHEDSGVPLLFSTKHVTFRGKALELKEDI